MFKKLKISHKILILPGLSAIAFFAIFFMIQRAGSNNEKLLTRIETGNFPAFELSRDLVESLAGIQRGFQDAVGAADAEMLDETDGLRDSFLNRLKDGEGNVTLDQKELHRVGQALRTYYSLARATSKKAHWMSANDP